MKAPYPVERSRVDLLYQTFAFVTNTGYDDIIYLDTVEKLLNYLADVVESPTVGRGRAFDFAITEELLQRWHEQIPKAKLLFDDYIWVCD